MPAGGGQDGMDIGAYVHLYGREFVHTDVRLALEYYLAAARVQGDTAAVRGRLLRELLTESRAYGAALSPWPARLQTRIAAAWRMRGCHFITLDGRCSTASENAPPAL
jgi:hypothetical protein